MKNIFLIIASVAALFAFQSCGSEDGNSTGSEYMPDMAHSIAYEANVITDYYYNTWDSTSTFKVRELSMHNKPVKGTIPRGHMGVALGSQATAAVNQGQDQLNSMPITPNGHVPYHYSDTEEERTRASAEITANPFPITENGLARGKELYEIYCGICHGKKGDGNGWLVDEANVNAKYPAAPANFLLDTFLNSSNGRFYHGIMYGKNVMGGYADKISFEERWQVIHWIRALQAKEKKVKYSAKENTFNMAYGTPASMVKEVAQKVEVAIDTIMHGDGHDHHGHDGDGHDHSGEAHGDGHDHGTEGESHEGHSHGDDHNHSGHDH